MGCLKEKPSLQHARQVVLSLAPVIIIFNEMRLLFFDFIAPQLKMLLLRFCLVMKQIPLKTYHFISVGGYIYEINNQDKAYFLLYLKFLQTLQQSSAIGALSTQLGFLEFIYLKSCAILSFALCTIKNHINKMSFKLV